MPNRTPFPGQVRPEKIPGTKPEWKLADCPCPDCGAELCLVQTQVTHPLVRGGRGIATYLGCPACGFAGPAVIVAD